MNTNVKVKEKWYNSRTMRRNKQCADASLNYQTTGALPRTALLICNWQGTPLAFDQTTKHDRQIQRGTHHSQ